jgi:hypothetical protein
MLWMVPIQTSLTCVCGTPGTQRAHCAALTSHLKGMSLLGMSTVFIQKDEWIAVLVEVKYA